MSTFRFYCSKKSNKNESICFLVLWSPSFLCNIGEYFTRIKATMAPPQAKIRLFGRKFSPKSKIVSRFSTYSVDANNKYSKK